MWFGVTALGGHSESEGEAKFFPHNDEESRDSPLIEVPLLWNSVRGLGISTADEFRATEW